MKTALPTSSIYKLANTIEKQHSAVSYKFYATQKSPKTKRTKSSTSLSSFLSLRSPIKYKFLSWSKLVKVDFNKEELNGNREISTARLDVNTILGRRVSDVSKNKFKFISSKSAANKRRKEKEIRIENRNRFKLINSIALARSSSKLSQFKISKNGTKLKRLNVNLSIPTKTKVTKKYKLNTKFKLIKSPSNLSISHVNSETNLKNRFKWENRPFSNLNSILIARLSFFHTL